MALYIIFEKKKSLSEAMFQKGQGCIRVHFTRNAIVAQLSPLFDSATAPW